MILVLHSASIIDITCDSLERLNYTELTTIIIFIDSLLAYLCD